MHEIRLEADAFVELTALLGDASTRLLSLVKSHGDDLHPGPRMERHVH